MAMEHALKLELGKSTEECAALVAAVTESPRTHRSIQDLKASLRASGVEFEGDAFERVLLSHGMDQSQGKIDTLRVPLSVRELIRKQYQTFSQPAGPAGPSLAIEAEDNDAFIAACKLCTLDRKSTR